MKNDRQKIICYTIEREFLAKITVVEFINRMVQKHIKDQSGKERMQSGKVIEREMAGKGKDYEETYIF